MLSRSFESARSAPGGILSSMVESVRAGFPGEALVPENAQTVGALGAALSYEA